MKISKMLLLVAALILLGRPSAFADAVLSLVPSTTYVNEGDTFTVGVYVTGPTVIHSGHTYTSDVTDLDAFQFDIAFNCILSSPTSPGCQSGASLLSALSVTEGSFLSDGGLNFTSFDGGSIDNTSGEITGINDISFTGGVTGSGDLVDITFQALKAGKTNIAILGNSDLLLLDSNGNPITVDDSVTTSPTKETFPTNQSLSASVVVTPEPPSIQLMFLGALALLLPLARPNRFLRHLGTR